MKNLEEIKEILPHRYPFLMIDRVLEVKVGTYCKALKNVTVNEEFFQGHFPQQAVFPGVLMIEALAQTAGMVIHSASEGDKEEVLFFFAGINNVKFRAPVIPGDQLILETTLSNRRKNFWVFEGRGTVDGKVVVQGEVRLMK
jgi:3-hydroxyacyl-[acyl-carrier-protein] dehydratase